MRRRWRWPILGRMIRFLSDLEGFTWWVTGFCWFVCGALILVLPAVIVDTNGDQGTYLGTYLLVALIVYVAPLILGTILALGFFVRFLIEEYGQDLIPRRVTESAEDIRERYHVHE